MTQSHPTQPRAPLRILALVAALALSALACSATGGGGSGGGETPAADKPTATPAGPRVLFKDDFSDSSSGWGTGTDDTGSLDYTAGQYVFKITKEKWFTWGNLKDEEFENVRIEADVQNKSGTQEPSFGIMCDYQDNENYYYAGLASDGYYAIVRTEKNEDTFLSDPDSGKWVKSDDISTSADSYKLALECANGAIKLTVDGKTIASVEDSTFTKGQIGLFVLTFDTAEADVRFDNLRVLEIK